MEIAEAFDTDLAVNGYYEWEVEFVPGSDFGVSPSEVGSEVVVDIYTYSQEGWYPDSVYNLPIDQFADILASELEINYGVPYEYYAVEVNIYLDDAFVNSVVR